MNPATDTLNWSDPTHTPDAANSVTYEIVEKLAAQGFADLGPQSAFELSIDLTCSQPGSSPVTYALAAYGGEALHAWISLDAANFKLTGTTPAVATTTTYNIYVNTNHALWASPKQKQITLTVNCYATCEATNCSACEACSKTRCTTCNAGYQLHASKLFVKCSYTIYDIITLRIFQLLSWSNVTGPGYIIVVL